jgi:hypothetical protein
MTGLGLRFDPPPRLEVLRADFFAVFFVAFLERFLAAMSTLSRSSNSQED